MLNKQKIIAYIYCVQTVSGTIASVFPLLNSIFITILWTGACNYHSHCTRGQCTNNRKVYITCKNEITHIVSKQWHWDSNQDSIFSIWASDAPFTFWKIGRQCLGFFTFICFWSTGQAQCLLVTFVMSWMLVPLGYWYLLDAGTSWVLVPLGCWYLLEFGTSWMLVPLGC